MSGNPVQSETENVPNPGVDAHALAGPAPVVRAKRIESLDVIRGVAVLGILLMNIDGFALAWAGTVRPTDAGIHSFGDLLEWAVMMVFFEGTMRGLFSLLFGAGVILLTSRIEARATPRDAMKIYYRRNLWLLVFGLVHAYILLWSGDILYIYGLTALFLYPLRKFRPLFLIEISVVILLGLIALQIWVGKAVVNTERQATEARAIVDEGGVLTDEQEAAIDEWRGMTVLNVGKLHKQTDAMRADYLTTMRYLAPRNFEGQTQETIKWSFWDAASVMLLGMALMKLGVLSGGRSIGLYIVMMLMGYGIGVACNLTELIRDWTSDFHPVAMNTSFITYDIGRIAVMFGHLGAIVLFVRSGGLKWLARAFAAAGRMALTNYIMQTVICTFIFYGYGLGQYDRWDRSELILFVFAIWTFQLMISPIWLHFFRFGPLEWAWRSLAYWKRQPLKRNATPAAAIQ